MSDHPTPEPDAQPVAGASPEHVEVGLRERKKRATRTALTDAGLRLVAERGLDAVTVDQICAAVEVSPRTFFNYFASKEEALVGPGPMAPGDDLLTPFEDGTSDERLLGALGMVLATHFRRQSVPHDQLARRHELLHREPTLQMHFRASLSTVEDRLALAVARREDRDPDQPEIRLLVGIVATAIRSALGRWARGGGTGSPADHVAQVFAHLDRSIDTDLLLEPTGEP